jgi:hypothetical protein
MTSGADNLELLLKWWLADLLAQRCGGTIA